MRRRYVNVLIVAAVFAVLGVAYWIGSPVAGDAGQSFGGTDAHAVTMISTDNPNYVPRWSSLFKPGSTEIESGLFALQAALGGIALGFVLGALSERHRRRSGRGRASALPDAESGS